VSRNQALRRRRDDALIAVVLAAVAALLALGGGSWRVDRLLYDTALALTPRATPADIVIVAIDDASIDAIGRWPWPRTVHATLLDRLAATRPRAVALDLVLSEADPDPAQDRWLAQALARLGALGLPVVAPVAWQALTGAPPVPLEPTLALRPHLRLGAAEPAVDADGVLRHVFLRAGPAGAGYPHLALALLQAGGEDVHPALHPEPAPPALDRGAWQRDGRLLLRYVGPPGTVQQVSYVDVLQGAVPPRALAGRYVLIGMTAQGLGDTLATPVNARHSAMPGVEVLAQTLHLLRSGDGLLPAPAPAVALGSAAALVLLVLGFRRLGARRALPLALLTVPLATLASAGSLAVGWVWSPVPYALPALLAYPLWSWRRLEHAVAVLDREIQRLAAEPLVDGQDRPAVAGPEPDALSARLRQLEQAGRLVRGAGRFLAGALEGLPTGMLVGDAGGRVALANARAAALFEVGAAADLRGLDLRRLLTEFQPRDPLDWAAALAALQPAGTGLSVEAALAGGEYLVHATAIELMGERRLIVSVADLAPVRAAQRQREETLAFVSHDLRAPANAILMLTDLQAHGRAPMPPEQLLPELRRLAARTLALSEDFVQAARAQTRPLQCASVSLAALVEEGVADLRAHALSAGVALQLEVAAGETVWLDRALVARAIANLVSNAIKHSPAASVVRLDARRAAGRLVLQVTDAGPGLGPDQAAALATGDDGVRVAGPGGIGLGLVFVQHVARRHGGRVSVAAGRSSTIELVLQADSGNP
jgi:hypothetical protein